MNFSDLLGMNPLGIIGTVLFAVVLAGYLAAGYLLATAWADL